MPSTFFGLSIGTSGLYTYQAALNTTGHNVANAQTIGYSRQETIRKASDAISIGSSYGMVGTGVDTTDILRVRNEYYDIKYRDNTSLYGEYAAKEYYMLSVENYFSEVNSDGTCAAFDDFYNSLKELKNGLGDDTKRTDVAVMAQNYTEYMNYVANGLLSLQQECNFEVKNTADQINSIAQQIATLNKQINTIEMTGNKANDLRDSRTLLLDELSLLANVSATETNVGEAGSGVTEFQVRIDGMLLVDNYEYNTLKYVPRENKVNQGDEEGLVDLFWNNGQEFRATSPTLGGKLQALFEFRDGNNEENLSGKANSTSGAGPAGEDTITLTGTNINSVYKLNIPASDGLVKIGGKEYEYKSFDVAINAAGEYTYTFILKDTVNPAIINENGQIGEGVDYKGIPFYMAQINEFARTFSANFNQIHKEGRVPNSDNAAHGLDFFNAKNKVTGQDYVFTEDLAAAGGFSSLPGPGGVNSYYLMTAGNFTVSKSILNDPRTIATALYNDNNEDVGIEQSANLDRLIDLKTDKTMFRQGDPNAFLRTLTAEMGINTKKASDFAESQSNILKAIDSQRMSISGVDEDDEAMNLVKFKNAYDLSAKVIQIMNEIYDKLINGMV